MSEGNDGSHDGKDFMYPAEFATRIGVSEATILRWSKIKDPFPKVYRVGKKIRFSRAEVERWIAGLAGVPGKEQGS